MVKTFKTKFDSKYLPQRGDIVWMNFNPTRGHEQSGKRPALVVSIQSYNSLLRLALICPITSHINNYPFEVACVTDKVSGRVLSDQIKSMDWKERKAIFITKVDKVTLKNVIDKIKLLIED